MLTESAEVYIHHRQLAATVALATTILQSFSTLSFGNSKAYDDKLQTQSGQLPVREGVLRGLSKACKIIDRDDVF